LGSWFHRVQSMVASSCHVWACGGQNVVVDREKLLTSWRLERKGVGREREFKTVQDTVPKDTLLGTQSLHLHSTFQVSITSQ
jgi:hypothetical protein